MTDTEDVQRMRASIRELRSDVAKLKTDAVIRDLTNDQLRKDVGDLQQTKGSLKLRTEQNDRAGVMDLAKQARKFTPEHVARIEKADDAITELRKIRNGVYANKTLTPEQRKQALAGIHRAMVRWGATATWSDAKYRNVYKTPKPPWL